MMFFSCNFGKNWWNNSNLGKEILW